MQVYCQVMSSLCTEQGWIDATCTCCSVASKRSTDNGSPKKLPAIVRPCLRIRDLVATWKIRLFLLQSSGCSCCSCRSLVVLSLLLTFCFSRTFIAWRLDHEGLRLRMMFCVSGSGKEWSNWLCHTRMDSAKSSSWEKNRFLKVSESIETGKALRKKTKKNPSC